MGLFGSILGAAIDVATSPIEVIKDVATLGGAITDEREPYTVKRVKKLADDAGKIRDEIEEL